MTTSTRQLRVDLGVGRPPARRPTFDFDRATLITLGAAGRIAMQVPVTTSAAAMEAAARAFADATASARSSEGALRRFGVALDAGRSAECDRCHTPRRADRVRWDERRGVLRCRYRRTCAARTRARRAAR